MEEERAWRVRQLPTLRPRRRCPMVQHRSCSPCPPWLGTQFSSIGVRASSLHAGMPVIPEPSWLGPKLRKGRRQPATIQPLSCTIQIINTPRSFLASSLARRGKSWERGEREQSAFLEEMCLENPCTATHPGVSPPKMGLRNLQPTCAS